MPARDTLSVSKIWLAIELALLEQRILQDVGEDIAGERHVLLQHSGEIAGVLNRGGGVQVPADILDGLGDLQRIAAGRALEGHVLEDVRDAVLGLGLAARAGLGPDAQRRTLEVRHVVGQNGHAVGQGCTSHAHRHFSRSGPASNRIVVSRRTRSAGNRHQARVRALM